MRVAIAVMPDASELFPGPYGHAPLFAIYVRRGGVWERVELRENPFKAVEGRGKPRLMQQLLGDCALWVGTQFGHHGPGHDHAGPGEDAPRRVQVPRGLPVEAVLQRLEG